MPNLFPGTRFARRNSWCNESLMVGELYGK
jgi:hypothetical protein